MTNKKETLIELQDAVIRICPACGVVNPAAPSSNCPHLQLVRFEGVPESFESLLDQVAQARRTYSKLVSKLKLEVMIAVKEGRGHVETPRKVKSSDIDSLYQSSRTSGLPLNLTHPEKAPKPSDKKLPLQRKRKSGPLKVDPRQLDLIAQSPAKGDA